jgi:hypothetical protein
LPVLPAFGVENNGKTLTIAILEVGTTAGTRFHQGGCARFGLGQVLTRRGGFVISSGAILQTGLVRPNRMQIRCDSAVFLTRTGRCLA